jgi:hypothetical protein
MKGKKMKTSLAALVLSLAYLGGSKLNARGTKTAVEKTEAAKNDVVNSTKKTIRTAKEKGCRLIHGKMECLGKKVKNRAQNLSDKTQSKIKVEKNKINN